MLWETLINPKQESESPLTRRMTVLPVTPELVLAQEVYMMTPTRVEMRQRSGQIMATGILKPWGTSWCYGRGHSSLPNFQAENPSESTKCSILKLTSN